MLKLADREELRAKFIKTESILFKLRWEEDDKTEQQYFMESLNLQWQPVSRLGLSVLCHADW